MKHPQQINSNYPITKIRSRKKICMAGIEEDLLAIYRILLPGRVLFFFTGGDAAAAWADPGADDEAAALSSGAGGSCWCGCASSGLICSWWSPSLIPNSAATAAADELDAIAPSRFVLDKLTAQEQGNLFPFGSLSLFLDWTSRAVVYLPFPPFTKTKQ